MTHILLFLSLYKKMALMHLHLFEVASLIEWFIFIFPEPPALLFLQLSQSYDSKFGGFGSAPKFPRPVEIQLMLYYSKKSEETGNSGKANEVLKKVLFTLQCMAKGGIHDHVGGGFHRYSVDECWHG